jgi:hypothetical protein
MAAPTPDRETRVWDDVLMGVREFSPRLEILPAAQRRLWGELVELPEEFVLYGGTAVALHLGHRHSIDFDFFSNRALNVPALETGVSFLAGARIVQRGHNTLSAIIQRGGRVQTSFFGVPNLPRLEQPHVSKDNNLKIASLLDLAGTKASVVQVRAEAKEHRLVVAAREVDLEKLPDLVREEDRDHGL